MDGSSARPAHALEAAQEITGKYCFECSFIDLTFQRESQGKPGWTSLYHYGINLGPVVSMCENYRSGLPWRLTRRCPYIVTGLWRAGLSSGWLYELLAAHAVLHRLEAVEQLEESPLSGCAGAPG